MARKALWLTRILLKRNMYSYVFRETDKHIYELIWSFDCQFVKVLVMLAALWTQWDPQDRLVPGDLAGHLSVQISVPDFKALAAPGPIYRTLAKTDQCGDLCLQWWQDQIACGDQWPTPDLWYQNWWGWPRRLVLEGLGIGEGSGKKTSRQHRGQIYAHARNLIWQQAIESAKQRIEKQHSQEIRVYNFWQIRIIVFYCINCYCT